ncbi:translation initiation factor eIF-2A [Basidiobolus meristosporus CBS 931.73]|uniref:Eukaryotic translation initiation factor 2A n=1 Tax=Basidiobolus meristosporus CBS 931.73 TaxID=1314790 RepID=A0A1Y1Y057_9FUNG|nr:translation initiation factor eIF-2A [Basidiobolus meristosporus CBS 931.73]|eukprot:ORX91387.1 translation initiation factor eIF-2A [Basidiobolus meristosporus CBS 931.73]
MEHPPIQFAYRSISELGITNGPPNVQPFEAFEKQQGSIRNFKYSKDGKFLVWATTDSVRVVNTENGEKVCEIPQKNIIEVALSPKGTYLTTWERYAKQPDDSVHKNLILWEVESAKQVASFTQKSQSNWDLQWTDDELFCARMVTNEIHFFMTKSLSKGIHSKLRLEGMADFSISPGKSPAVAVFIAEKKGAPAIVRMYGITNFNVPLAQKTFFKADKVQFMWNNLGTNLLVLTQTEVDKTGKSYYGETNLYFMSVAGNYDCRVALDKEGPIHDVAWSPNAKEFIVIYGYMPAKATLFDHRANPVHQFGALPRNFVKFNPHGRIICIAGFGNLAGTMDLWDRKTLKKIATIEASGAAFCDWSPDGRHIMTAVLSPRLRVDNGIKIWHHTGVLVYNQDMKELYQVGWRPDPIHWYPERSALSPAPKGIELPAAAAKPVVKAMGAYRPPHARGTSTPKLFKREDEAPQVNSSARNGSLEHSNAELSKAALKNKKKREAKKKQQEHIVTTPVVSQEGALKSAASALDGNEKKIRTLTKKLRQITDLKERQAKGESLEATQLEKIKTEAALLKELEALKL